MGKTISKIAFIIATSLLTGCVFIINAGKPTEDEQNLMNIQASASQQVAQINQQVGQGNYSLTQVQQMVNQAKKAVDDNLQKIDSLKLPQRTQALADKTKQYLEQAQQTYNSFLQMSDQGNQKLQELIGNLQIMSQPLLNMSQQLNEMKNQFLNQLKAATSSPQQ